MTDGPRIERIRHDLKRRRLRVTHLEPLPAGMIRIVLSGEELAGFTSCGFDDHVKLFFPSTTGPVMRDFTPRYFDLQKGELWIDFFLHEAGPATAWAAQAAIGQTLEVGGPKGSTVIAMEGIDTHVLIGDETALPAISRRLEELPVGAHALVVIETETAADRPALASRATTQVIPVFRDRSNGSPAQELIGVLRRLEFPAGRSFVWVAHESQAARAIRTYLREARGFDKTWIKAAGYWRRGASSVHDKIADDD